MSKDMHMLWIDPKVYNKENSELHSELESVWGNV